MASEFTIHRRVEFSETDMAGIMHFSNFYRFMETAEHAFLRSLGFSVVMAMTDPPVGWPRVHCECDFFRPVKFEDVVQVRLKVLKKSTKTITYGFDFALEDTPDQLVARGSIVAACVTRDAESGMMKSIPIPAAFDQAIQVHPDSASPSSSQ